MKKMFISVLIALTAVAAFAVDFSPNMVAEDAQWVMHANFDKGRSTEFGQFVMSEMKKGKCRAKLEESKALLNMDPSTDIASVTAYGWDMEKESGAMLIDGRIDEAAIVEFLSQVDGFQTRTVDGYEVMSWTSMKCGDGTKETFATFTAQGMMVVSDSLEGVAKAADVLAGRQGSIGTASVLNLANQGQSAFMAAAVNVDQAQNIPAKAALIKQSKSMVFSVSETAGSIVMTVKLNAPDTETAMNVDSIARGMLAMMYLQSQENPELAEIAKGVTIVNNGTEVVVGMRIPVATVIDMYYEEKINVI
jgi:hypothetical protein